MGLEGTELSSRCRWGPAGGAGSTPSHLGRKAVGLTASVGAGGLSVPPTTVTDGAWGSVEGLACVPGLCDQSLGVTGRGLERVGPRQVLETRDQLLGDIVRLGKNLVRALGSLIQNSPRVPVPAHSHVCRAGHAHPAPHPQDSRSQAAERPLRG